jgi:hypothetical protein
LLTVSSAVIGTCGVVVKLLGRVLLVGGVVAVNTKGGEVELVVKPQPI